MCHVNSGIGKRCYFPNPEEGKEKERLMQLREGSKAKGIKENGKTF